MKILKNNTKEAFDTEHIELIEIYHEKKSDSSKPLHHTRELTNINFYKSIFR